MIPFYFLTKTFGRPGIPLPLEAPPGIPGNPAGKPPGRPGIPPFMGICNIWKAPKNMVGLTFPSGMDPAPGKGKGKGFSVENGNCGTISFGRSGRIAFSRCSVGWSPIKSAATLARYAPRIE